MRVLYPLIGIVTVLLLGAIGWVLVKGPRPIAARNDISTLPSTNPSPRVAEVIVPETPLDQSAAAPELSQSEVAAALPLAVVPFSPQGKLGTTRSSAGPITGSAADYLASMKDADPKVIAWMREWEQRVLNGGYTDAAQINELSALLASSKLPFNVLYAVGRAVQDVESPEVALPVYQAAVRSSEKEFSLGLKADDASTYSDSLHYIFIHAAWPLHDFLTSEKIWRMQWAIDNLNHSDVYVAELMSNEMLMDQNGDGKHFDLVSKAGDGFLDMLNRHGGHDFTADQQDELHWMAGQALFFEGKYVDALTQLDLVVKKGTTYKMWTGMFRVQCLAKLDRLEDARKAMGDWIVQDSPGPGKLYQLQRFVGTQEIYWAQVHQREDLANIERRIAAKGH